MVYDAIVIGAGHNGLTAVAVMARDGMRVLVLEKNQYTGGMAATTELIRGYRHEIAGSILFPVPDEIYESLRLDEIATLEPEVQSVNLGGLDDPPMVFWSDPEKLMNHLMETVGMDAVVGMAEIAAWCEAPARALGRHEARTLPKTLDEMFACAENEKERDAIRTAMFGSVGGARPLPPRQATVRGDARHALVPLGELHVPRPLHARQRDVPGLRYGHRRAPHAEQDRRRHRPAVRSRAATPPRCRRRGAPPRQGRGDHHREQSRHRCAPHHRRDDRSADRGLQP
jgi:hypothetical protein